MCLRYIHRQALRSKKGEADLRISQNSFIFLSRKNLRITLKKARLDLYGTDMVDFKTRFVIVYVDGLRQVRFRLMAD